MNESKVLLFKKVCYDVGTRFSLDGKTYHASVSNMLPIDIHGEFIINERIIKEE